ncbi:ecdysteroid 22-kinase family protein [Candidatus Binatia bacterium]|nr:ecdysteroid 22-kinase family protein [Candidatus Binatia bacterium]
MPSIPTPETIDAAWLTERLREAGHAGAAVRQFTATPIGTGQMAKSVRFELSLNGAAATVPRSLVGKFPSDDPMSRQTAVQLRNYIKEVSFYRELRPRLTISVPRCYFAAIEGDGPEFALLLEDLAPRQQGNQLAGCSEAVASAAVLELVGLHAPTWCDRSLLGIGWLGEATAETAEMVRGLYRATLPGFLDRFAGQLSSDEAAIISRVGEGTGAPFLPLRDPFSLIHVDYRLDNLLIDEVSNPPRVAAVDWQTITMGSPLSDVAYFLGAGMQPEARRRAEGDIVREYYEALCRAGVSGYPFERCWEDYRRGTFAGFVVTVIATVMVQQTARGDEMFLAMARRHSRHALDLGAEEFLG